MFKVGGWSAQLTDKTYDWVWDGWKPPARFILWILWSVACVQKWGIHQKTRVPPNSSEDFGNVDGFWDVFLASLILRFCIYIYIIYIYTIHDILNSCGWRTGNPARFNRWSSLTETIFQHERRMQQLVVSCILDFPIHFCGINPINTLFVRS